MNTYIVITILLFIMYYFATGRVRNLLLRDILRFVVILYSSQLILAAWDPYEVYPLSFSAFFSFHVQIIVILISATQYERKHANRSGMQTYSFKWPSINVNFFVLTLVSILLVYTLWNYHRMQTFLITQAAMTQEVREHYFRSFFPNYTSLMIDNILVSFKFLALILSFTILLSKKKMKWKERYFVLASLAICLLQALMSQSRLDLITIVIIALFFVFVARRYDPAVYKKKIIPAFSILFGVFVIAFFATTLLRSNLTKEEFDMELFEQLFIEPFATYFYIPILAFDYGREHLLNFNFPFFGAATFAAVYDTILLPFVIIDKGINSISMAGILGSSIGAGEYLPSGKHWMAMYTGCANYYLDFWYLGFLIFPFIHGKIIAWLSTKTFKNSVVFILAAIFFFCTFRHSVTLTIQSVRTVFFLFWLWMLRKNQVI